jgi:hypothetical protein
MCVIHVEKKVIIQSKLTVFYAQYDIDRSFFDSRQSDASTAAR